MAMMADEYSDEVVPATEGTVVVLDNGGGSFRLTPTSLVEGWTFAGWDDDGDGTIDNTTSPRDVTLTESKLVYDAIFEDHRCTLYSPKYPAPVGGGGTVSAAAGSCECDWVLTATPASGWAFKEWNDGSTVNPRTVSVDPDEEDKSYTATFVPACSLNEPVIASVTGLGTSSVTQPDPGCVCSWQLSVTAAENYTFQGWEDDGSAPATRTVTSDADGVDTYTPIFVLTCMLNVPVVPASPNYTATVTPGITPCTWTLTVVPNEGYTFQGWVDDGSEPATRTVTSDADGVDTYTPIVVLTCSLNQPVIAPATGMNTSSVTPTGSDCEWTLSVTANDDYRFVKWTDEDTNNPRTVTSDADGIDTYTPVFELKCLLYPPMIASVAGLNTSSVTPAVGDCEWILTVTPSDGYSFDRWTDGNTDNPRTVTASSTGVDTYTPVFSCTEYERTITGDAGNTIVVAEVANCGLQMTATPAGDGWDFIEWSDGSTTNPRIIYPVDQKITLSATFEDHRCAAYGAKVTNPVTGGTVTAVNGACECDWTLTATPTEGYAFLYWNDGNVENPRTVTVDPDAGPQTYTATFITADAAIDGWTADKVVVRTKKVNLGSSTATIYTGGTQRATGLALTQVDAGYWSIPAALNSYAGETLKIIFSCGGNPVSTIDSIVPYVSTGTANSSALSIPTNADVQVVSGTLTFDADATIAALDIYADAKAVVPVSTDLTLRGIYMRAKATTKQYPQLVVNGSVTNTLSNKIFYDYALTYTDYYPLAVPYDVACSGIKTHTGKAASFEVQWYNGDDRAANASGWTVFDDQAVGATLRAGKGYIIYAVPYKWNGIRQSRVTVRFPMVADLTSAETEKSTSVSLFGGEWTNTSNRNWNFVGNPYLANYTTSADNLLMTGTYDPNISTPDNDKYDYVENTIRYITQTTDGFQTYEQSRAADAIEIKAFNTFFLQAASTGTLVFSLDQRAQNAPIRRMTRAENGEPREIAFGVVLTATDKSDRTGLLYGEDFTDEYEMNADLVKMSGSTPVLELYSLASAERRAFNALSLSDMYRPVPLGFRNASIGEMTFRFDSEHYDASPLDAVMLTDYETGRTVNLLEEDYRFTTSVSSSDVRFVLHAVLAPEVATGLNGQIVNEPMVNGIYDLLGRKVDKSMLPQGVYIIVENGEARKEVIR